jgi:hypothetical protein
MHRNVGLCSAYGRKLPQKLKYVFAAVFLATHPEKVWQTFSSAFGLRMRRIRCASGICEEKT